MEKMFYRLFDCMVAQHEKPKPDLLNRKEKGRWRAYNTHEVQQTVNQLTMALLRKGVSWGDGTTVGRDKIAIISESRPEWIMTDLAVQQTGAILVPLYPNSNPAEIQQILTEAAVKGVFISTKAIWQKFKDVFTHVPGLQWVYSFEPIEGCADWTELFSPLKDADLDAIKAAAANIKPDDVATIIYTSGTTGRPKGVMLTHKNILSNVDDAAEILSQIPLPERRAFTFLPLNHILEKMMNYVYLFNGFSIYYADSMDTIGANMKEVRPYLFTAVPRLLEKVFERILAEGQKLKGIKKRIFDWSLRLADRFDNKTSTAYKLQLAIADRLVYSKWRAAIGGNVKAIVVGGSACPIRLQKMFTAAKMVVMEGYGLTETSPILSANHYHTSGRKYGTVGPLFQSVQVKIAPDGEILCKGPNVMVGYYKDPALTASVFSDGWLHTGDIGEVDSQGFLKITDRKKEVFKTSGGKYVAPQPIENRLKESLFIEQIMVVGAERKFTAALIVPAFEFLTAWCQEHHVPHATKEEIIRNEKVVALYHSIIQEYNPEFNPVEQIKKFVLLPNEWTIEAGELTPSGKMKRRVILDKHQAEIDALYGADK